MRSSWVLGPNAVAEIKVVWHDLGLVALASLALLVLAATGEQVPVLHPLRAIVALVYVVFVPGHCAVAALFPRSMELDGVERLGLRLGLGLATIALLALVLDRLPWGLAPWPILIGTLVVTMALSCVALWRRARVDIRRWGRFPLPSWRSLPVAERRVYAGLGGMSVIVTILAAWVFLVPTADQFMTEFYMLGPQAHAEGYPYQSRVDEPVSITLGIVNRERYPASYSVEVWVSDPRDPSRRTEVSRTGPIFLLPGESHVRAYSWAMPRAGDDQQIEILLFRDGGDGPYRSLRVWLNVRE